MSKLRSNIDFVEKNFQEHLQIALQCRDGIKMQILEACEIINQAINQGKKLFLFGNGGSAADAQHIAAEFTGRFVLERNALPAIALTTDTSAITAISNDYGYQMVFQRQVEALAQEGDILIGISTSGNSKNVINALLAGRIKGCKLVGLLGNDGGEIKNHCDLNIIIPTKSTARIQEMHILVGHIICDYIDNNILNNEKENQIFRK